MAEFLGLAMEIILQYPEDYFESHNAYGIASSKTRHKMVKRLKQRGLVDPNVIKALQMIPRHLFVDEGFLPLAYEESRALPIGYKQTLSQPLTVATMTQWLFSNLAESDGKPISRVLEIGTGSGYQTAILAVLAKQVFTLERIAPLAGLAQNRLHKLAIQNVFFGNGDGHWGWAEHGPYDAIISAAAPDSVPDELVQQLRVGGRLVIPVGRQTQRLTGVIKHNTHLEHYDLGEVNFVPMLKGIQNFS